MWSEAEENAAPAAVKITLKAGLNRQLMAENADLKKQIDSTVCHLYEARENMDNMMMCVDSANAREEELEKELEDLKSTMNQKEEEVFSLSAVLQVQDLHHMIVENEWKAKFEALQENYEEKLRNDLRKEVASLQLTEDLMKQIIVAEEKLSAEQEELKLLKLQILELQVRYIRSF